MNTDPRGRCFLSYRRSRSDEAELLIAALHDFGVPTWQDITDLREESTESALRGVVDDPSIASAVLWITPDVAESHVIRQIEAPGFINRARLGDAFYVVPVCAGGVDYGDAGIVIDPAHSLETIPGWNLCKIPIESGGSRKRFRRRTPSPSINAAHAKALASRVLKRRVQAIHAGVPAEDPIRVRAVSRTPPVKAIPADLVFDWRHNFDGRRAPLESWSEQILPGLKTAVDGLLETASIRRVVCEGFVPLAGAVAIGATFLQPLGLRVSWQQTIPGGESQEWGLQSAPAEVPLETTVFDGDPLESDLAVLVSVNANTEGGFAASRADLPGFRSIVHIHAPEKHPFRLAHGGEALCVAERVVEEIKSARDRLRNRGGTHLFLSCPAGLAFLIGQLSNQFMPMQTYEFDPESHGGRYYPAALIERVSAVTPL